jgi:2-polyprenyl-3-methyl-5-hydroxy-6-metoxy-1,4-benzoquinol methylase
MDTRQAYNAWSTQYDTNENKTRDLEAQALRESFVNMSFNKCLEIGCGTGKNTSWLVTKAKQVTSVDLSEEMLAKAKQKITSTNVEFKQADITKAWDFASGPYDLITFSLVLEHIEDLQHIFSEVLKAANKGAHIYIGELHPFKQYAGSKARFETEQGVQVVQCYTHNITDFVDAAAKYGFELKSIDEYFDNGNRNEIPRILKLIFKNG